MSTPWELFKQAAQLGEPERVPVALIVDSPWLPGYAGIDTRDYFLLPDQWLEINLGLLERFVIPGERHSHFRLREDALQRTIQHGLEDEIKLFRDIAKKGLGLMKDQSSLRRRWLEEMYDRYTFLEKEFPGLMERWQRQRKTGRATSDIS